MGMRFEFENPEDLDFLPKGRHATEVLSGDWVGNDLVVKLRLAPERTDCLLWVDVDKSKVSFGGQP